MEASAFLDLTLPVVRYRVAGIHRDSRGRIVAPNRIIAKVSRVEVASKFLAPPPERMLRELVERGELTCRAGRLWPRAFPWPKTSRPRPTRAATPITSPPSSCFRPCWPCVTRCKRRFGYDRRLRIGRGRGHLDPWSAAAALAMGASYLVTGSVNQSCVEAGTSDAVRRMLAQARRPISRWHPRPTCSRWA